MTPTPATDMPIPFGIDADTGLPLDGIDEAALKDFRDHGHDTAVPRENLSAKSDDSAPNFGTIGDVDPNDLTQAGWGVIFGATVDPKIREALQPLLDHRKAQAGGFYKDGGFYQEFDGPTGVIAGDDASAWLKRMNVRMDVVDPQLGVPYYITIVASPEEISYEFQYGLDLYWAVGRIWFRTADEFRQYAESVIRYETMQAKDVTTSRQMAIFATQHDLDGATQLFSSEVAQPLVSGSGPIAPVGVRQKFKLQSFIGDPATKDTLRNIFTGAIPNGSPAMLFSGGHGKSFKPDDPRQADSQGALLTQDWLYGKPATRDMYFDGTDLLSSGGKLHGMIHFLFACYGGGCPQVDNYNRMDNNPKTIANQPMVARLPQAELAHPDGGALAVLAHVDRAWAYSFRAGNSAQTQGFRDVIGRIMRGDRLGQATDQFNIRWAALSSELSETLDQVRRGLQLDPKVLANKWVSRDDARNYVVFGDPAVRLRVDDMPALS